MNKMIKKAFILCLFVPTLAFAQKIDSVLFSDIQCSGWEDNVQHLSFDLKDNTLNIKGTIAAAGCGDSYIRYELYDDSIYLQRVQTGVCESICLYEIDFTIDNCTSGAYKIRYNEYDLDVDAIVYAGNSLPVDYVNAFEADSTVWRSRLELGFPEVETIITETILYGDTVIDDTRWRILTRGDIKGLIRTEGAKVFFRTYPGYERYDIVEDETVIYDFSLKVGDPAGTGSNEVINVDSVLLNDGRKHKKIYFAYDGFDYVEGLGCDAIDPFYMIYTVAPTMPSIETFICCHADGELLYMNPDYLDCSGGRVGNEIVGVHQNVKISYAGEQLQITSEDGTSFDVAVYNMQGMLVEQQKGNYHEAKIPLSRMVQGVYIVRISSGKYVYTQKIIK